MTADRIPDVLVKVECGNCGDLFVCYDLRHLGGFALMLHQHWLDRHRDTNIHGPATTVYLPIEQS